MADEDDEYSQYPQDFQVLSMNTFLVTTKDVLTL